MGHWLIVLPCLQIIVLQVGASRKSEKAKRKYGELYECAEQARGRVKRCGSQVIQI